MRVASEKFIEFIGPVCACTVDAMQTVWPVATRTTIPVALTLLAALQACVWQREIGQ